MQRKKKKESKAKKPNYEIQMHAINVELKKLLATKKRLEEIMAPPLKYECFESFDKTKKAWESLGLEEICAMDAIRQLMRHRLMSHRPEEAVFQLLGHTMCVVIR